MDDAFGCFACGVGLALVFGAFWLVFALKDARDSAKRAYTLAEGGVANDKHFYELVMRLDARIAALEAELARAGRARELAPPIDETARREASASPAIEASPRAVHALDDAHASFRRPEPSGVDASQVPAGPAEPSAVSPELPTEPIVEPIAPSASVASAPHAPAPASDAGATPPADREPPQPAPAAGAPPKPPEISLEQWIGVRGAAAAGSVILAIAAVYFFRYSVEHGFLGPTARVVIGTLLGLGCVGISEIRFRHTHRVLAEFLAGAGFAILYLSFWAASSLYALVPSSVATILMIAVTGAACALAHARASMPVAVLGLLGGFATPILLSTGQDRPIALFSYLLLLDGALLVLARTRSWPAIALASLGFTFFYQFTWFTMRLDPPRMWLGVGIVVVFAVLFAIAMPRVAAATPGFRATRIASVLLPGFFAFYFGASARLGSNLVPTCVLLVLLAAGGALVARTDGMPWLRTATVSAAIATLAAMRMNAPDSTSMALTYAGTVLAIAFVQVAANEFARRRPIEGAGVDTLGFDVAVLGPIAIELAAAFGPRLAGLLVHYGLVVILVVVASLESLRGRSFRRLLPTSIVASLAVSVLHIVHADDVGFPPETAFLGLVLLAALATQLAPFAATRVAGAEDTRLADHGAGFASVWFVLHLAMLPIAAPVHTIPHFGTVFVLYLLTTSVATRRGSGAYLVAAVVASSIAHGVQAGRVGDDPRELRLVLAGLAAMASLVALTPLLVGARARSSIATHRAASLAGPSVLPTALFAFDTLYGDHVLGLVPLVLALFGVGTLLLARRVLPEGSTRTSAFAWSAVASLSLVSIAIPVQLRNEWVTVSWAIQAAAVIFLWRRFDHAGLKYYATMLFAFAFIRLVANPAVLEYHPPSGRPVVNWLAYTYIVPVAALVVAARILAEHEVVRFRPLERKLFPETFPPIAATLGLAAVVVGFAWVNLTVFDAFAVGRTLRLELERGPARDLTLSLAWALYAVLLLAIGMARTNTALRRTSLALILLTTLKVFLYDLGNLEDLYRVASLVGLAFTLIGISLAYRKFVFREEGNAR